MPSYREHYKELLKLGLPIVIGQLGVILVSFADTFMVGWHSTEELGAASFVNNIFNLAIVFAIGFSYGLTPIVGKLFGEKRYKEAGTMLKNALLANGVLALLVMSAMWLLYINMHRLGQPTELLPLMRPYYMVLLLTLPFTMLFNAFKQFIDGITDTKTSMWIMLSGNIINIIFNYILIFGKGGFPELGLLGAGIATLLSRMAMLAFAMIIFFRSSRYRTYMQGFFAGSITLAEQKHLNSIGMPVALQMGMETASFSLVAIMVGWLGTKALAAHQIMCTVGQLGFMIYYGMAAAVAVKTSNYNGAGDIPNIRRSANAGFRIIAVMAIIASFTMLLLRNRIGDLFTNDKEVALLVSQLIIPFVLYQFGDGLQCSFSNALRGIADVKPVMRYAFISYFVISLPIGYLFAFTFNMGLTGIWLSFPFGLTTAGVLFYLRFRKKTRIINN